MNNTVWHLKCQLMRLQAQNIIVVLSKFIVYLYKLAQYLSWWLNVYVFSFQM